MSKAVAHSVFHAWHSSGVVVEPAPDRDGDVLVKHIGDVRFVPGLVQAVVPTDVSAADAVRRLRKIADWIEREAVREGADGVW